MFRHETSLGTLSAAPGPPRPRPPRCARSVVGTSNATVTVRERNERASTGRASVEGRNRRAGKPRREARSAENVLFAALAEPGTTELPRSATDGHRRTRPANPRKTLVTCDLAVVAMIGVAHGYREFTLRFTEIHSVAIGPITMGTALSPTSRAMPLLGPSRKPRTTASEANPGVRR
jgi:hypothetical protein